MAYANNSDLDQTANEIDNFAVIKGLVHEEYLMIMLGCPKRKSNWYLQHVFVEK